MYTHDSADITSEISPTSRNSQIFDRVEAIGINHEVPVVLVNSWSFASIPVVEKFWECLSFDVVDLVHIKPSAVTWKDDRVCL